MHCNFAFSTREYIEADQYLHVVKDSKETSFSRVKLLLALARACEHYSDKPDVAFHLLATIEYKLLQKSSDGRITTDDIVTTVLGTLEHFDTKAYLSYLAEYPTIHDARDLRKILSKTT